MNDLNVQYDALLHKNLINNLNCLDNIWKLKLTVQLLNEMKKNNTNSIKWSFDECKNKINYRSDHILKLKDHNDFFEVELDDFEKEVLFTLKDNCNYFINDEYENYFSFNMDNYISIRLFYVSKMYLILSLNRSKKKVEFDKKEFLLLMSAENYSSGENYKIKDRILNKFLTIEDLKEFQNLNFIIDKKRISFFWGNNSEEVDFSKIEKQLKKYKINNTSRCVIQTINIVDYFTSKNIKKIEDISIYEFKKIGLLSIDSDKEFDKIKFEKLYYDYLFPDLLKNINKKNLTKLELAHFDFLSIMSLDLIKALYKMQLIDFNITKILINDYIKSFNIIGTKLIELNEYPEDRLFNKNDIELIKYFKNKKNKTSEERKLYEELIKKTRLREFELFNNISLENFQLNKDDKIEIIKKFGILLDNDLILYSNAKEHENLKIYYLNNHPFNFNGKRRSVIFKKEDLINVWKKYSNNKVEKVFIEKESSEILDRTKPNEIKNNNQSYDTKNKKDENKEKDNLNDLQKAFEMNDKFINFTLNVSTEKGNTSFSYNQDFNLEN